jgi:IMP dehydrogenase
MTTLRELRIPPIWVNPQHLASTAGYVLSGHKMKVCGVIDCDRLVGVVTAEDIAKAPLAATVNQIMSDPPVIVDGMDPVRKVAERFADEGLEYAAVVDMDHYVGMLTPAMLLRELGKSYDPMTGLSWSDQLRSWGIANLENGEEVTILFIDLNDFGQYNKLHGHIVGDQVLTGFSNYLRTFIDSDQDLLVRYGGDEFAIGTRRPREEADRLAQRLSAGVSDMHVGDGIAPVTFTIGIFGGRRQKERLSVHYAATVDNLINMASKACQAQKSAAKGVDAPIPEVALKPQGYRVVGVFADGGEGGITTVILSHQGTVYSGASTESGARGVLEAAARAVENSREDLSIRFDYISNDNDLVEANGAFIIQDHETALSLATPFKSNENLVAALLEMIA